MSNSVRGQMIDEENLDSLPTPTMPNREMEDASSSTNENVTSLPHQGVDLIVDDDGPPPPLTAMMQSITESDECLNMPKPPSNLSWGPEEIIDGADNEPSLLPLPKTTKTKKEADGSIWRNRNETRPVVGVEEIEDDTYEVMPDMPGEGNIYELAESNKKVKASSADNNDNTDQCNQGVDSAALPSEEDLGNEASQVGANIVSETMINSEPIAGENLSEGGEADQSATLDFEGGISNENSLDRNDVNTDMEMQAEDRDLEGQVAHPNITDVLDHHGAHVQRDSSLPGITEAYPVHEDVIMATPAEIALPWWKQRRTRLLFIFVFLVLVALIVGVTMRRGEGEIITKVVVPPEETPFPSASVAPTSSQVPSMSPSSCAYTVSSNMKRLELLHPNATDPTIAIDGRNLVVVSKVAPESIFSRASLVIIFYSLADDDNRWEETSLYIEGGIDGEWGNISVYATLSDKTAMVSLVNSQTFGSQIVLVFRQNSLGRWEKISHGYPEPAVHYSCGGFGSSAKIDGNLMVVADRAHCYTTLSPNAAYLFRKEAGEWVEIEDLSSSTFQSSYNEETAIEQVSISGETIAVKVSDPCVWQYDHGPSPFYLSCHVHLYKYDQEKDSGVHLVNTIAGERCGPMALSGNHLVLAVDAGVILHRRPHESLPFEFLQFFNSSDYGLGFGSKLSIDKDTLIVGSENHVHIFSNHDQVWKETLTLDNSYRNFQLSGRALLVASQREASVMNIADCTQSIPTQVPSVSVAPSTCYGVEFRFIPSRYCEWRVALQRIEENGVLVVETFVSMPPDEYSPSLPEDYHDVYSFCLHEGQYQLKLADYDSRWTCSLRSDIRLVTHQEWFDFHTFEEPGEVILDIPFKQTATPSVMPSISHAPSSSQPPSAMPSISHAPSSSKPTETRKLEVQHFMTSITNNTLFDDPSTPQAKALDWLVNKDAIDPPLFLGKKRLQRYVLAAFYFSVGGGSWHQCNAPNNLDSHDQLAEANALCTVTPTAFSFNNMRVGESSSDAWLTPVDECMWAGVVCWGSDTPELDRHIDQLEFEDNGLSGMLLSELGALVSLRLLLLEKGSISSSIPSEYGKLKQLLVFDVDYNQISGSIPEEIYNLTALQQLDLNGNQITGSISTMIGKLKNITFFQVDHNLLTGKIPKEMGDLKALKKAFLHDNNLTGDMPVEICANRNNENNQGSLEVLAVDNEGDFPEVRCSCCTNESGNPTGKQDMADESTPKKPCITQTDCEEQLARMGFESFHPGEYKDYGCFSKNGELFWGVGGTDEQLLISDLGKKKERVWCD